MVTNYQLSGHQIKKIRKILMMVLIISLLVLLFSSGCQRPQAEREDFGPKIPGAIPSLCESYADYFPIGTAVNATILYTHKALLDKHFNSITAENEMKYSSLQPSEGAFNWTTADKMVEYAYTNGKKIRGHTLVWHNQTPAWVFKDPYDSNKIASRELLLERMETHIKTVVGRYKGKIYAWDVVNEAIPDGGGDLRDDSPWYEIIGPDYIEYAFRFAHEADPDALLFYNDYNAYQPTKRDKIYKLAKGLIDKGVPIHGVGMQGHWDFSGPDIRDIEEAIKIYSSLGLKVEITELDLSLYRWNENDKEFTSLPSDRLYQQAVQCKKIFELFRKYKDVISNVTFWGIADDMTWKDNFPVSNRKDWPLLFNTKHDPKQAFWAVVNF